MAVERWRMLATGRVQGVGYRLFVQEKARRFGLVGYVRNLADGRVEAEAEGERERLEALKAAMEQGPRRARVDAVFVEPLPAKRTESAFIVR